MKKLILLLFCISFYGQENFPYTEYNNCEIYPQLVSGKDFIKEITRNVYIEEPLEISFYVSEEGDYFALMVSKENYRVKINTILKKLGKWYPGKFNGEAIITKIKFKVKLYEEDSF